MRAGALTRACRVFLPCEKKPACTHAGFFIFSNRIIFYRNKWGAEGKHEATIHRSNLSQALVKFYFVITPINSVITKY